MTTLKDLVSEGLSALFIGLLIVLFPSIMMVMLRWICG